MIAIVEKDLRRWKLARNADGQVDSAVFWRAAQQSSANLLCVHPMSLQSHSCMHLRKFTPVCKRRYTRMHPSRLWEQAIGVRAVILKGRTEQLCWVHARGLQEQEVHTAAWVGHAVEVRKTKLETQSPRLHVCASVWICTYMCMYCCLSFSC